MTKLFWTRNSCVNMFRNFLYGLLVVAFCAPGFAPAAQTLIDSFDRASATPWGFWGGLEFPPGATGAVTIGSPGYRSSGAMVMNYNIGCAASGSPCAMFASSILDLGASPMQPGSALAFMARFSNPNDASKISLEVRLADESGQSLLYYVTRPLEATRLSGWYRALVPFKPYAFWGGANNGVIQGKIKAIWIVVNGPVSFPATGTLYIDDLVMLDATADYDINPATTNLTFVPASAQQLTYGQRIGVTMDLTRPAAVSEAGISAAHSAGASFVRSGLYWDWVEPTPGVFDFSNIAPFVQSLEAKGMGALFVLGHGHPNYDVRTAAGIAAFARYAQAAAEHFRGRNVAFEIWNEPNGGEYWFGARNAEQYAALCKAAVAAVHIGNPSAIVSTGGLGYFDFTYLKQELAAGAAQGANAIGLHAYRPSEPETLVTSWLSAKLLILGTAMPQLPVWNTEWGYSTDRLIGLGNGRSPAFLRRQATMTVRAALTQWALDVPKYAWHSLFNEGSDPNNPEHNYGLLYTDVNNKVIEKPALRALRALSSFANGRTNKGLVNNAPPGLHVLKLDGPTDVVFVVWSSMVGQSVAVYAPNAVTGYRLDPAVKDQFGNGIALNPAWNKPGFTGVRFTEKDGPMYVRFIKG
jgi:hypothetical protein